MSPPRLLTGETAMARRAAIRLGVQAAVLVASIVVALTAVATIVIVHAQRAQASALLDAAIAHADDVGDPPSGVYLVLHTPDGRSAATPGLPIGASDPGALAAAGAGDRPPAAGRDVGGVPYEVATARRADGVVVQAVLDLTANHAARDGLLRTMLATGVVGLLLAGAVGTWLGHRALVPLSTALALQRRFVADAGHELRTPLTLLGTRAQLLRRRLHRAPAADQAALDEADGVVADSGRLTAILEDLLLAADPFTDRPREELDLVELCRDAVGAAAGDARGHGVELRLEAPSRTLLVHGSPPALLRAVTALVDNAVRHAAATVVVSARPGDRAPSVAVVEVRDDGHGVDPVLAPRLFNRFSSGDTGAGPGRRRHGLGLALIAEIAAAHGGRIELGPCDPDTAGAAFRLVLPTGRAPRIL